MCTRYIRDLALRHRVAPRLQIFHNINNPGSYHDADLVDDLLRLLEPSVPLNVGLAGDLGFRGARFKPYIQTIHSKKCRWPADPLQRSRAVFADEALTYMRQAVEWAIGGFKNLSARTRYVLLVELLHVCFSLRRIHRNTTHTVHRDVVRTVPWLQHELARGRR